MNRSWFLVAGLAVGLVGCAGWKNSKVQSRSQIGEDPIAERDLYTTIGVKTTVGNTEPIPVVGVGLVYRLAGTGSAAPSGGWRSQLENSLKKQGYRDVGELLNDPAKSTSLVLVSAIIPPGARKGDPLDVHIVLPDDSRTTSLSGGVLLTCDLINTDSTRGVREALGTNTPTRAAPDALLTGSVMAKAEGPVVAGALVSPTSARSSATVSASTDADGNAAVDIARQDLRAGLIWGGGKSLIARPYYLLLNPGEQNVRTAMQIAERLNATFQGTSDPNLKIAEAKTKDLVVVNVPPAYRHNHYRFLLVSRQVPLLPVAADSPYRRKLNEELSDSDNPATALTAAIKLEALGQDSKQALRIGLESPSPWVRFASAEALAYLGQTDGALELARLAEGHPALRAQCLKALASIDDTPGTDRLMELMASHDPQLRFGAFLALRMTDEQNPTVRGTTLNHALKLHQLAPGTEGLIHLTSDGRGEVVVFGENVKFRGPFALPAGDDITVSVTADKATVSRIVKTKDGAEAKTVTCTPDVAAVVAAIAKLGGSHAQVVKLLQRASLARVMTAPLAVDAIPRQFDVNQLVAFAKSDPTMYKADREVARLGTLGQDGAVSHDLPTDPDAKPEAKAEPIARKLSRDPGRLFGPKRPTEAEEDIDVLPSPSGVVPASGTTPKVPVSRDPGRIFGSKKPAPE